jgi:hypothetical protein
VEVIDFISWWPWAELMAYLKSKEPIEWLGISSKFKHETVVADPPIGRVTLLTLEREQQLFTYYRTRGVPIVIGGPQAEVQRPWLVGQVDWVIKGYADTAVIALHDHLVDQSKPVTSWLFEDSIRVIDADSDYGNWDLNQLETTFDHTDFVSQGEVFPIEIARGCKFKCSFCTFSHTGKEPGTYIRSMESIGRDISDRWNKYGGRNFLFLDDTFNDSVEKMQDLADLRASLDMPWEFWAYCRLDLLRAQPEQQALVDALGWRSMTWGIETFDRNSGKAVGKGANPDRLKEFIHQARTRWPDNQFMTHIIVGLPNDTHASIIETADWFIENPHLLDSVRFIPLFIYNNNDPYGRTHPQAMANNPKDWGYDTMPSTFDGKPWITLKWSKPGMNMLDAIRIAHEQNARVVGYDDLHQHRWPVLDQQNHSQILPRYIDGKRSLLKRQYTIMNLQQELISQQCLDHWRGIYAGKHMIRQSPYWAWDRQGDRVPITDIFDSVMPKTILDYGSGNGRGVEVLRTRSQHCPVDVTCYDPAWPGLEQVPVGTFDMVIAFNLLENVEADYKQPVCNHIQSLVGRDLILAIKMPNDQQLARELPAKWISKFPQLKVSYSAIGKPEQTVSLQTQQPKTFVTLFIWLYREQAEVIPLEPRVRVKKAKP